MADPKMVEELTQQLEATRKLLTGPEWSIWTNFLKRERRQYLQNRVNAAVKTGNTVEAQIALALMEDCLKQIELFGQSVREAESKIKGAK